MNFLFYSFFKKNHPHASVSIHHLDLKNFIHFKILFLKKMSTRVVHYQKSKHPPIWKQSVIDIRTICWQLMDGFNMFISEQLFCGWHLHWYWNCSLVNMECFSKFHTFAYEIQLECHLHYWALGKEIYVCAKKLKYVYEAGRWHVCEFFC